MSERNMDQRIMQQNESESNSIQEKIERLLEQFKDIGFEKINSDCSIDEKDEVEIEDLLQDWVEGDPKIVQMKLGENPIDNIKALLWKQKIPEQSESNVTPVKDNYEGIVAKIRRINSEEDGYLNDEFYIEEKNEEGDLPELKRLKNNVILNF